MKKTKTIKEDGRYLIYYSFNDEDKGVRSSNAKEPAEGQQQDAPHAGADDS